MHNYGSQDTKTCLEHHKLIFVGDSSVRSLYWATRRKLNPRLAHEESTTAGRHADLSYSDSDGVDVAFYWDPYLNTSRLYHEVQRSTNGQAVSPTGPSWTIIIGGGLWHARHLADSAVPRLQGSLDRIARWSNVTDIALAQRPDNASPLLLLPIQPLQYEALDKARAETMTPSRIESLNDILKHFAGDSNIPVAWAFARMTEGHPTAFDPSGLHVTEAVVDKMVDLILNRACNNAVMGKRKYPRDTTCCFTYPEANTVRTLFSTSTLLWSTALLAVPSMWWFKGPESRNGSPSRGSRPHLSWKTMISIVVLLQTANFCYLADRTHLLSKIQKTHDLTTFLILSAFCLLAGLFSLRVSKIKSKGPLALEPPDQDILSRDQTDEWKGWMQFLILLYHYTGVSQTLWVYKIIRLLVASYLFMTGFGHARFFYKSDDFSFKRSAAIIIRLNMLSCLLAYAMNTDYSFYYFAPLVTFWYGVAWTIMRIGHQFNKNNVFVFGKIAIAAIITTYLISYPVIFTALSHLLQRYLNVHIDAHEWQFRLRLDCLIVYFGMMYGITLQREAERKDTLDLRVRCGMNCVDRFSCFYFPVVTLILYIPFFLRTDTKQSYNRLHPIFSILPVMAFVVLRNSTRKLRITYSATFASLGRISLETFTLQFHLWLAADTKGILSLGLFDAGDRYHIGGRGIEGIGPFLARHGKWLEFVILSALFLRLSLHVAAATQHLTTWIIDGAGGPPDKEGAKAKKDIESPMPVRTTDSEKSQDEAASEEVAENKESGVITSLMDAIGSDLRLRVGLILLMMWVFNMVDRVVTVYKAK